MFNQNIYLYQNDHMNVVNGPNFLSFPIHVYTINLFF